MLGSFDHSMAGFTLPAPVEPVAGVEPVEPSVPDADVRDERPLISPAAQAVADRLLGRTAVRLADPVTGAVVPVTPQTITVGRSGDAPAPRLVVDRAIVSRHHCAVRLLDGTPVVTDLGSVNGTVVVRGGEVVAVGHEPVALRAGDVIATAGGAHRLVVVTTAVPRP